MIESGTPEALGQAAMSYLEFVASAISTSFDLSHLPQKRQQSTWMVPSGPTGYSSQLFERDVLTVESINFSYQIGILHKGSKEQTELQQALVACGVRMEETYYGFLVPLFASWTDHLVGGKTVDDAIGAATNDLMLAVFADGVESISKYILNGVTLDGHNMKLDNEVVLRPITDEELWEMGTSDILLQGMHFPPYLFSTSNILEIKIRHGVNANQEVTNRLASLGENALALLCMGNPGGFECRHWGNTRNFGMGSLGRSTFGGDGRRFRRSSLGTRLDMEAVSRIRSAWPRFQRIMNQDDHFLRLPARRLVDGLQRTRDDDAVLDFSIALETLLTSGSRSELSYRFSLRGAMVLGWESGDRTKEFKALQSFYDVRSSIIHGDQRHKPNEIREARDYGEGVLRSAWWWFFNVNNDVLSRVTEMIDARILIKE